MILADLILIAMIAAFVAWMAWEIRRAPIEPFDRSTAQDDHDAADECIAASRPAPLDRPHVRAGTAWGKEL